MGIEYHHHNHLLADSSALIAIGGLKSAQEVFENIGLTTTNVCLRELRNKDSSRESWYVQQSASTAINYIEDGNPTVYNCVGARSHGYNVGEKSLVQVIEENEDQNLFKRVLILDTDASYLFDGFDIQLQPPNYPFYILNRKDMISDDEFCRITKKMCDNEKWNSRRVIEKLVEYSGVDCSSYFS